MKLFSNKKALNAFRILLIISCISFSIEIKDIKNTNKEVAADLAVKNTKVDVVDKPQKLSNISNNNNNLKQREKLEKEKGNKINKIQSSFTVKHVNPEDAYQGRCFHRFGNDFFDFNKIGNFNIKHSDTLTSFDVNFNICNNLKTSCSTKGLVVGNDEKCVIYAGDSLTEKKWILDGKKNN